MSKKTAGHRRQYRGISRGFLYDKKVLELSEQCALFFICLWFACDDEGYFEWDSTSLAAELGRFRSQEISRYLRVLHDKGMVMQSRCHEYAKEGSSGAQGVGKVTSWHHQHIPKPYPSKWNDVEIQWLDAPIHPEKDARIEENRIEKNRTEQNRIVPMGSFPIGQSAENSPPQEPLFSEQKTEPEKPKQKKQPTKKVDEPEIETPGMCVLRVYRDAIKKRYNIDSADNATMRSQAKVFVQRVGKDDAPLIAEFYVLKMSDAWLLKTRHPFGNLLKQWESVRSHWLAGRSITTHEAQSGERAAGNIAASDAFVEQMMAEDEERKSQGLPTHLAAATMGART